MLRNILDKISPLFEKGGKLEKYYSIFEMADTFLYTPSDVAEGSTHVRDGLDLKRMMITVVIALLPCILFGMYNTGLQAGIAFDGLPAAGRFVAAQGWRGGLLNAAGPGYSFQNVFANILLGASWFVPLLLVSFTVGGFWEALFAIVRKHEINEGFLVTGMLFPLILPPTLPLWQAALGISFGIVLGKEVFGGIGKNFLNPALTSRAFLFFAYPAQMSPDSVWVGVDGFSGATPLSEAAYMGVSGLEKSVGWSNAFWGFIPGSIGETSTAACLFGALILILSGIGSWRIMVAVLAGACGLSLLFNFAGSEAYLMSSVTPVWHLVLGGFAFGTVFMATDPVSAAMTRAGQWLYGFLIGFMVILIRVVNPAFPEGMMLAILFGNVCAPLIDYYVVKNIIKRRMKRNG